MEMEVVNTTVWTVLQVNIIADVKRVLHWETDTDVKVSYLIHNVPRSLNQLLLKFNLNRVFRELTSLLQKPDLLNIWLDLFWFYFSKFWNWHLQNSNYAKLGWLIPSL